ncbi:hypothetical protein BKI52_25885 [marine bacterium AO1-C]|nr:hypothetical protein BKI52_25885 [marine bacterium AO1-C]
MVQERYAKAYYEVFIIALVITFAPSKLLAYLTPFICIGWFIFRANSGKTLYRTFIIVAFILAIIPLYYFIYSGFIVINVFIIILTYSSFIFIFVTPGQIFSPKYSYLKYIKVIKYTILIQSFFGIFQLFGLLITTGNFNVDGSTGDVIQGTINPFSFLTAYGGTFSNAMFAVNMVLLLTFFTPYMLTHRKGFFTFFIGLIVLFLASVMHVLIGVILGFAISLVIYRKKIVPKFKIYHLIFIVFLVVGIIVVAIFAPQNFNNISRYGQKLQNFDQPKTYITYQSFTDLPSEYNTMPFIGLGPGQFASRASLIGTGKYFGEFEKPKKIPFLKGKASPPFDKYLYKLWEKVVTNPAKYGHSAMTKPYYSILAIYTEFGLIVLMFIFFILFVFIYNNRISYINNTNRFQKYGLFSIAVMIIFLVFISFIENYLEVPQAIFPGLVAAKFIFFWCNNFQTTK